MKTILLTGAAGFIGSHLAQRLVQEGHTVLGVDNLCTGRMCNLKALEREPKFHFIEADVSKTLTSSNQALSNQKFDHLMHFASPASPPKYFGLPIETLLVNAEGTKRLLDLAHQNKAQFFLASTSEVYGDPLEHPQPETYWGNVNPIGVRSIYDEGKRYAEAMTYAYYRKHNVDVRVIRIFNTYGPHMDPEDGRVVTNLLFQALNHKPLTIYGDGSQTRSFQYVSDLIEGIIKLMNTQYVWPVNLGNPSEFTILDFAKKVQSLVYGSVHGSTQGDAKTQNPLVFEPLPQDDPKQRKPDIYIAKKVLQWEPKISLDEGLKLTLNAFRQA